MAMASPSTLAAAAAAPTASALESDPSHLEGIEALKLKVGPVRRNLFGPVDHRQLEQDFQRLLCMSVDVANERWNFDFQRDRPAQGSSPAAVEWEVLACSDVPAFYRSCTVGRGAGAGDRKPPRTRRCSTGEASQESQESSGGSSGDEYLEVTAKGRYRIQRASKRKQANITEFFKVKRRRLVSCKGSPLR